MNAIVGPLGQPAAGVVKVGNLYADLQSRTLWLGVTPAVDSTGSVLISDMLSSMQAIEDSLDDAKAYTDDQLAHGGAQGNGYALLHQPTFTGDPARSTDIAGGATQSNRRLATTEFVQKAIQVWVDKTMPIGTILMWSGSLASIGVGNLVDWCLCDGSHGSPNLVDKFIVGASAAYPPRTPNPNHECLTSVDGAHTHTVSNEKLTVAQLPIHGHAFGTLKGVTTGTSHLDGKHYHITTCTSAIVTGAGSTLRPYVVAQKETALVNIQSSEDPGHVHGTPSYGVDLNSGATANTGSDATHTHTVNSRGDHQHTIGAVSLRQGIPWVAIAYIYKFQ